MYACVYGIHYVRVYVRNLSIRQKVALARLQIIFYSLYIGSYLDGICVLYRTRN